jgi:hypothetical protein
MVIELADQVFKAVRVLEQLVGQLLAEDGEPPEPRDELVKQMALGVLG